MHSLRSPSILRGFRLAAFLFLTNCLLLAVAIGFLAHAVINEDWRPALIGFGIIALACFVDLARALVVGHVRCPLCMYQVFSPFGTTTHSRARKVLGSYRLRVALSILFRHRFTCPSCNEPTAMKLRPRTRAR